MSVRMIEDDEENGVLLDERVLPIFIESKVDDMGLSPNAIAVYIHILAKYTGRNAKRTPTKQAIADFCFDMISDDPDERLSYTEQALDELYKADLIE